MHNGEVEITEELIFEYWDCPQCGKKEIRGDIETCPACGLPRNDNIKFYRKAVEEKVEEKKAIERFESGPDWRCSYCATLNAGNETNCRGCGNTRSDSEKNYFQIQAERESKEQARKDAVNGVGAKTKSRIIIKYCLYLLIIIGLCLGGYLFWANQTHSVAYKVTHLEWERSLIVAKYQWSEKEDWEGALQGVDIREISRQRKIHHYEKRLIGYHTEWYDSVEQVQAGFEQKCSTNYRSTGSGASRKTTSCRSVPKYISHLVRRSREVPDFRNVAIEKYFIKYQAKSYLPVKPYTQSGNDNFPRWPEALLGVGLDNKPDKIEKRSELYKVKFEKMDSHSKGPAHFILLPTPDNFESKYLLNQQIPFTVNNRGVLLHNVVNETIQE